MTTRTTTVNTPEETQVQICDECGLGEDAGELVEFTPDDPDLDADLHYHRDCAREKTGNPQTLSEAYHDAVGANMKYKIAVVLTRMEFNIFAGAFTVFVAGASMTAFQPLPGVPTDMAALASIVAFLGMAIVLAVGRENGHKTAEEMV